MILSLRRIPLTLCLPAGVASGLWVVTWQNGGRIPSANFVTARRGLSTSILKIKVSVVPREIAEHSRCTLQPGRSSSDPCGVSRHLPCNHGVACYASFFSLVGSPPCTRWSSRPRRMLPPSHDTLEPEYRRDGTLDALQRLPSGVAVRISSSSHAVLLVSRASAVPATTVAQGAAHDQARRSPSSPRQGVRRPVPCRPW